MSEIKVSISLDESETKDELFKRTMTVEGKGESFTTELSSAISICLGSTIDTWSILVLAKAITDIDESQHRWPDGEFAIAEKKLIKEAYNLQVFYNNQKKTNINLAREKERKEL